MTHHRSHKGRVVFFVVVLFSIVRGSPRFIRPDQMLNLANFSVYPLAEASERKEGPNLLAPFCSDMLHASCTPCLG